jgi:hypothetical protein
MLKRIRMCWGRLVQPLGPTEPDVRVADDGFAVVKDGEVLAEIRWADVNEVFAFKLDLGIYDRICLGFRVSEPGGETIIQVNEGVAGYQELVGAIERVYPDHTKGWWARVAFPAFAASYTTIWRSPWPETTPSATQLPEPKPVDRP